MEYKNHEPRVTYDREVIDVGVSQQMHTQISDEKGGPVQNSFARKLFQKAYAEYLKGTSRIWSGYLASCEETCVSYVRAIERLSTDSANQYIEAERDYHAALPGDHRTKEEISEQAYRRYMRAILRAWDFERAVQQSKCAHSSYREALTVCADSKSIEETQSIYRRQLEIAWTSEIASSCLDFYNDHIRKLASAWSDAQTPMSQVQHDYLRALQRAWATIDIKDVDMNCLAELGQSMTSVAGGACPASEIVAAVYSSGT